MVLKGGDFNWVSQMYVIQLTVLINNASSDYRIKAELP